MTPRSQQLLALVSAIVLVSGLIAASTLGEGHQNGVRLDDMQSYLAEDEAILTGLKDYAATVDSQPNGIVAPPRELLPDVDQMIDRLAARLETKPQELEGWRMLGWSYLNTGRYALAAQAYRKALALDPNSQDLKLSYEESMTKASEATTTAGKPAAHDRDFRQQMETR